MELLTTGITFFQKGGIVMYVLLLCSLFVFSIGIERALYFRRMDSGRAFARDFYLALANGKRQQAEKLAAHFPVDKIEAVYSSDLARAMKTASCVADRFGLTVEPRPELRELNFGDWEGLTYDEIVAKWPDALENFFLHPDVLEIPAWQTSFPKLRERALACVERSWPAI
mgnify:CR=1 FL=1